MNHKMVKFCIAFSMIVMFGVFYKFYTTLGGMENTWECIIADILNQYAPKSWLEGENLLYVLSTIQGLIILMAFTLLDKRKLKLQFVIRKESIFLLVLWAVLRILTMHIYYVDFLNYISYLIYMMLIYEFVGSFWRQS